MSAIRHQPPHAAKHIRTLAVLSFAFIACYLLVAHPVFAQTGGTGNATQVGARVSSVATGFLFVLQVAGVAILTGAFMYVGYGMAWGGKKWSDVANVAYGCMIGGLGTLLVGWLFT